MLLTFDPTRPKRIDDASRTEPPTPDDLRRSIQEAVTGVLGVLDHLENNSVHHGGNREFEATELLTTASRVDLPALRRMVTLGKLYQPRNPWVKGWKETHAMELICDVSKDVLTREDQTALGFRLIANAAAKGIQKQSPDKADAARISAAQQLIATMDADKRQYAIDFVTGVAEHAAEPRPIRAAMVRYIREVFSLEDIAHVLNACGRLLVRWAGAAGTERPDLPKRGRAKGTPWSFDNSNLKWVEWVPEAERTTADSSERPNYHRVNTNEKQIAGIRAYIEKRASEAGTALGEYVATAVIPFFQTADGLDRGHLLDACEAFFAVELKDFRRQRAAEVKL